MIKAQITKEVVRTGGKSIGFLTLSQVVLVGLIIVVCLAIVVGLPPILNLNLIKSALISSVVFFLGLVLTCRYNNKLGWQWLAIIFRFRLRVKRFGKAGHQLKQFDNIKISSGMIKVNDNQYSLILEVSGLNLELLNESEQKSVLNQFQQFLNSMTGHCQILTKTRQLDISDYLSNFNQKHQQTLNQELAKSYQKFISNLGDDRRILHRESYIVLSQTLQSDVDLDVVVNQLKIQAEIASKGLQDIGLASRIIEDAEIRQLISPVIVEDGRSGQQSPTVNPHLKETASFVKFDRSFCRNLAIIGYPAYLTANLLVNLTKVVDNVDVSYHYWQIPKEVALNKLSRKITEFESQLKQQMRKNYFARPAVGKLLQSAVDLRDQVYDGRSNLFKVSIYVNIMADSVDELNRLTAKLRASLASYQFKLVTNKYQQSLGLISTCPLGVDKLRAGQNFDGKVASFTLPLINGDLVKPSGILYGVSQTDNSLVILDRFQLTNANSLSLGQSGSGKSYSQKLEILRLLMIGCQVIIIDSEAEYIDLAKNVSGQIVDLADGKTKINILDVGNWRQSNKQDSQTVADLISIIESLAGRLTRREAGQVDQFISQLYQTESNPTLADLSKMIKDKVSLTRVSQALDRFVNGSCRTIFSQKSNIDLDNPLIVFNLANVADSLKPILLLILNFYFKWQLTNKDRTKLLVIDEAWLLMETPYSAKMMTSLVRRAQKHNLGVALISNQVSDFFYRPAGLTLMAQSALRCLFKIDTSELSRLKSQFHLSDYQINFLKTATAGQSIILADNQTAAVQVIASEQEKHLVETKTKTLKLNQNR